MKRSRHLSIFNGVAATGLSLYAISAQAQVCDTHPAFPDATVTSVIDRDHMMCTMGLQFPVLPPRLDDPNKPPNAQPLNPANPEGNWTDSRRHTVVRTSFGGWHTYDSDQGLAGGAMTGVGDYGPHSTPRYTDIDLMQIRKPAWLNPSVTRVTTPEDWWLLQRPQIEDSVQYTLYGRPIPKFPVSWVVSAETTGTQVVAGVSYAWRQKTFTGTVDKSSYPELRNTPVITAQCRYPAATGKRYPVVVTYGEGTARFQYTAPYDYGTCSYSPTLVQPDNGNNGAMSSYLIGLMNKGDWRSPEDAGSLVAWGWGVSRLIDAFASDPDIDEDRVAVEGHSRYGKATLVTAAYDDRVVVAWPSDAGAMGTAMMRRHYGESLEFVASSSSEYHWVNGNILQYAGPLHWGGYIPRKLENMVVDAHSTTALLAPRAIFVTNGTDTPPGNGDAWADPRGTYLSGELASPVWNLLGWKGQVIPEGTVYTSGIDESVGGTPPFNVAFIEGTVGWRRQIEGHTPVPNWPSFALFANRYLWDDRPVIAADQEFSVDEGSGGAIGAVEASDPDEGDTLSSWQVKGGDGAYLVTIDKDTGVLKIRDAAALAKNGQKKVRLTVFVGDGKRPSKDATVIVHLPAIWNLCSGTNQGAAVAREQVPQHLSQGYTVGNCAP
ncbi:MAG TPA: cadherin repeat domain-containing protein [Steroidobacteraceae bacterium]|nr:cadherin repeat domain-containing protein [Steroidobacteraceae bacterium]